MSDESTTEILPELAKLLHVLTTLFPDQYSNTKGWLAQRRAPQIADRSTKPGDEPAAKGTTTRSVGVIATNRQRGEDNSSKRSKDRRSSGSTVHQRDKAKRPDRVPGPPIPLWPTMPLEVQRLPSLVPPASWARSHGFGSRLQWHEENQLKIAFSGMLAFPPSRAGTMGVLIKFTDDWQTANGKTTLSVYHPRESGLKVTFIEVTRDDQVVAQFEVPLQLVDATFVMALLPIEWRRGT